VGEKRTEEIQNLFREVLSRRFREEGPQDPGEEDEKKRGWKLNLDRMGNLPLLRPQVERSAAGDRDLEKGGSLSFLGRVPRERRHATRSIWNTKEVDVKPPKNTSA